jgi:hypothetical protein
MGPTEHVRIYTLIILYERVLTRYYLLLATV